MAEYIEREALLERVYAVRDKLQLDLNNPFEDGVRIGFENVEIEIENIPAADVRPVRRGKWKQDELSKRLDLYVCSECGQPLQIVNADGGKTATVYCPNCGADMREES